MFFGSLAKRGLILCSVVCMQRLCMHFVVIVQLMYSNNVVFNSIGNLDYRILLSIYFLMVFLFQETFTNLHLNWLR